MKTKKLWGLTTLVLSSLIVSCTNDTAYNIDETITNVNGSVYYEIFVHSFCDSNADGIGDLNGVTSKMDYLQNLGVSGIWLMPIMPSETYHKYDVDDYYSIDEDYGTLADFENLIAQAHAHNIDVIIDLVVNHTSDTNPWFTTAINNYLIDACSQEDSKCDYYNFSHTAETSGYHQYYNGSNTGVYFESNFPGGMPDLNLNSENVRQEITDIIDFWITKGVDGFRLDAVTSYFTGSTAANKAFLNWLQELVHEKNPDAFLVGEVWDTNIATINSYYESGLDSFFNYPMALNNGTISKNVRSGNGAVAAAAVAKYTNDLKAISPTSVDSPFLSNHDNLRSTHNFYGDNKDYLRKLAASVYILMPGHPFMYYGEEIGLQGRGNDPSKRLPMIWSENDDSEQCLPPEGYDFDLDEQITTGATDLLAVPDSIINHYRKVISIRNKYPYMYNGTVSSVDMGNSAIFALKYIDESNDDEVTIVHNFSETEQTITIDNGLEIVDNVVVKGTNATKSNTSLKISPFSSVVLK